MDILCQGSLAILFPRVLDGWEKLPVDLTKNAQKAENKRKASAIDWYDIVLNQLRDLGINSEAELQLQLKELRGALTSFFEIRILDFLCRFLGDLAISYRSNKSLAPSPPSIAAAHFSYVFFHKLSLLDSNKHVTGSAIINDMLQEIPPGRKYAEKYELVIYYILGLLFMPDLRDPKFQVSTNDKIGRKDITFANVANDGFWASIRQRHGNFTVCFEVKNKTKLDNSDINQLSSRLSPISGQCGFICCRKAGQKALEKAQHLLPKNEIIIVLSDKDLVEACTSLDWEGRATRPVMNRYRELVDKIL